MLILKSLKMPSKYIRKFWAKFFSNSNPPHFYIDHARFNKRYPSFTIGACSYGIPSIRRWDKVSTLTIGSYCSIAKNVQIFLGGNHRTDWVSTYPFPHFFPEAITLENYEVSRGNVDIGNDVWLCDGCTILSGVKIGHGAVIACNAVISRDVPAYAVMAGNPAKLVRWRFDEETREALLKAAWWDWPEKEILQHVDKLCTDDLSALISYAKSRSSSN